MMKFVATTATVLSLLLAARAEGAEPTVEALRASATTQFIAVGSGLQAVEHRRMPGEVAASFKVASASVPQGTQVIFELISVKATKRVLRWRCVAVEDLAECFQSPVVMGFLSDDEALRLEVKLGDPSQGGLGPLTLALAQ